MTKTARDIIRHHLKRVYFNGSTDMVARQNGVIPNDTKLGETQIEVELNQALKELEAIHQQEIAKAKLYGGKSELAGILSRNMNNGDTVRTNASYGRVVTINERLIELDDDLKEHKELQ